MTLRRLASVTLGLVVPILVGACGSSGGADSGEGDASNGGGDAGPNDGSGGRSGGALGGAANGPGSGGGGGSGGSGGSVASCSAPSDAPAELLAFPEAQGFGRKASGGRAGTVYHVTNTNDSGAGSFRDAVSQSNRIVVFDVGGYITLKTAVSAKSNLTVAGQTAPGGGIGFRGGEISFANSSNVILRYVRIRPGDETASDTDDALSLYRARNVIVDHSSFEFAPWNDIDAVSDDWQNHPVTDVTFQDSLIADPTGQQFGAHTESVASQWSWYRNVFANSHNRNPLAKVDNVFVNNVLYNCSAGYTTHTSTNFRHDIVANYFVFGPASTGTDNTWYQVDKNQSIFCSGNQKDTNRNGKLDGAETTPYWYQGPGTILTAPWSDGLAATTHDAASAFRIAVSGSGALPRDELDALIFSQVRTLGQGTTGTGPNTTGPSGGLYTSQTQTGLGANGYGTIAAGESSADGDGDGMPDYWERALGWQVGVDDAMEVTADGYTRIEGYLNWLGAPHATADAQGVVDVDLSPMTSGFADVAPVFGVESSPCGEAVLAADGHTVHFQAAAGFSGPSSFVFTVTGSDGTTYRGRVGVLVGSEA